MKNSSKDLILWYDEPGDRWEETYLPIGNSFLGASMDGGVDTENIVLNEKSLWIGGPAEGRDYTGGNKRGVYPHVKKVQEALAGGDNNTAISIIQELTGSGEGYGAYQLLCNAEVHFPEFSNKADGYKRWLNLKEAVAGVEFTMKGVTYTREYFANFPSNVIVMKYSADKRNRIHFTFSLSSIQEGGKIEVIDHTLRYAGVLTDNGLRYESQFRLVLTGGTFSVNGNSVTVEGADEAVIYFSAATDYMNNYPIYRSGVDPKDIVSKNMTNAVAKGYQALKEEHTKDYSSLFGRVELDLGGELSDMTTDDLLKRYKNDNTGKSARYLEELYFQYGRYLLISSSREGTLPANLQGVWNATNTPPWCCDYHINVNLQMNYWPAYVTNLKETAVPLVEYVDSLREPGRVTAAEYYNIISDEKHPANGWAAHTQSTPFGFTCPGWDFYWGWSSAAAAWLDQNLWEYYEFTGDKEYLKNKIYPVLRESVVFYLQWLIYDKGQDRMVSSPSYSPEHGPVSIGNTYEQSLIDQLFADFITASELLGMDEELRTKATDVKLKLSPYHISKTGLLKEWFEEDDPDFDESKTQKNHRHVSHLLGLYPGKAITSKNPELMKAAVATLNHRGDESTGWARAYKLSLWARIGDGNRAYKLFTGLISSCTNRNLLDTHPPFQIDGNFGGTAGMAEMLLQSHQGYIELLPALPSEWQTGAFQGLCARNGFEVNASWSYGTLTSAQISSKIGGRCTIQFADGYKVYGHDGKEMIVTVSDGVTSFHTNPGEVYKIKRK